MPTTRTSKNVNLGLIFREMTGKLPSNSYDEVSLPQKVRGLSVANKNALLKMLLTEYQETKNALQELESRYAASNCDDQGKAMIWKSKNLSLQTDIAEQRNQILKLQEDIKGLEKDLTNKKTELQEANR